MPKKFVSKIEEIEGLQFTGTVESAKDVIRWVKESVGSEYETYQFRERVERSSFGFDTPHTIADFPVLGIYTRTWTLFLNSGDWLVLHKDNGWRVIPVYMMHHKFEEVQED